jgi:hypothetical protein
MKNRVGYAIHQSRGAAMPVRLTSYIERAKVSTTTTTWVVIRGNQKQANLNEVAV